MSLINLPDYKPIYCGYLPSIPAAMSVDCYFFYINDGALKDDVYLTSHCYFFPQTKAAFKMVMASSRD